MITSRTSDGHKTKIVKCKDCGNINTMRFDRIFKGYCIKCKSKGSRNAMFGKPSPQRGKGTYIRNKYNRKIKRQIVLLKGNKCAMCGVENLPLCCYDFHHIKREDKSFQISHITLYKIETLKEELNKCLLLCANCHRIIHHSTEKAIEVTNEKNTISNSSIINN